MTEQDSLANHDLYFRRYNYLIIPIYIHLK
jgi:hypothetical protein